MNGPYTLGPGRLSGTFPVLLRADLIMGPEGGLTIRVSEPVTYELDRARMPPALLAIIDRAEAVPDE